MSDLREALRQILGWRELRSGANEIPIARIEDIAIAALAAGVAELEADARRWRKLLTMPKSEVIAVLERHVMVHRPDTPWTLAEVVDAALAREEKS